MKRNQKQIDAEIQWLKDNKPKIRHYTAFGDDNWEAIEAQIRVLSEKLTESQIDNLSWFEDEEDGPESGRWSPHTNSAAIEAYSWMMGLGAKKPSIGWRPLIQKKVSK